MTPNNIWVTNVFCNTFAAVTKRRLPPLTIEQKLAQWNVFMIPMQRLKMSHQQIAGAIVFAFYMNPCNKARIDDYGVLDVSLYFEVCNAYRKWIDDEGIDIEASTREGYVNAVIAEISKWHKKKAKPGRRKKLREKRLGRIVTDRKIPTSNQDCRKLSTGHEEKS